MNVLSQMNDQIGDLDAEIQKKEEIEGKKKLPVKEQLELFQLRKLKEIVVKLVVERRIGSGADDTLIAAG